MRTRTFPAVIAAVLLMAAACSREAAKESTVSNTAAARASAGLVAPLESDDSADIVSWVDGQVITDWTGEIAKRDQAIERYLNDSDPGHAEKYGFRSGQHPRLAWNWFLDASSAFAFST